MRSGLGELVPRTHREAVIAAVDSVADRFAKLVRYWTFVLDRQIGNAAGCVEAIWCREGISGADIDASRTRAATVAGDFVRLQIHRRINFSEEKPRSVRSGDEVGMLPLPS